MAAEVHVGSILIEDRPSMTRELGIKSEPYSQTWGVIGLLDSSALSRKVEAAGWHFFFMAAEVKTMFFGAAGAKAIKKALQRILAGVSQQNFNCLEVTAITPQNFLGLRYTTVSAHWRHIQSGSVLDEAQHRRADHAAAKWAQG
jgi:hypothetical protein